MCESLFCIRLKVALDRAFQGEPADPTTPVGAWVKGFMGALKERSLDMGCPFRVIWHFSDTFLQKIMLDCPCDGLAETIVQSPPEAFLRSVVLMARMSAPMPDGDSEHLAVLN